MALISSGRKPAAAPASHFRAGGFYPFVVVSLSYLILAAALATLAFQATNQRVEHQVPLGKTVNFGAPTGGSIVHQRDHHLDAYVVPVEGQDDVPGAGFSIAARFSNPYPASVGDWSYGFLFRSYSTNDFEAVILTSTGRWLHLDRAGLDELERPRESVRQDNRSAAIQRGGGSNHLQVIATGDRGSVFINGLLAGMIRPRQPHPTKYDLVIVGSYFEDGAIPGAATRFDELIVRTAGGEARP